MRIQSTRVWLNEQFVPAQLVLDNGKITAVESYNTQKADVDYGDKRILPGLIDIHCHGYNGLDCNYTRPARDCSTDPVFAGDGVTSFLATTSTAPESNLLESFSPDQSDHRRGSPRRQDQGIHVEGPQIPMNSRAPTIRI